MSDFADTQSALGVAIAAQVPIILWGPPGQGKTQTLYAIAEQNGMHIENVIASIREPSDFAGLPYVVEGKTSLIPPNWAQRIAEVTSKGGHAMLFFDEISTAPPASQAALLRVALEKIAGDLHLGENVSIVAAANPPEQAADGWDLSAPMANRFCHVDWLLPAEYVRDGFSLGWGAVPVPSINLEKAAVEVQKAKILVASFLRAKPTSVTVIPKETAEQGKAYPTPRSWEMAATLYGFATAAGVSGTARRILINGAIGQGTSVEFLTFVKQLDLPDPEVLLKNPEAFEAPTRSDIVYAIGASVLSAVMSDLTDERWIAAGKVIATIANANHADVAVSIGKKWMAIRPESATPDVASLRALAPIFKEAKIIAQR